jgi:hypothetical protein
MMLRGLAAASALAIVSLHAAAAADWVRFGDATTGFEALFPVAPEVSTDNSNGIAMKSYSAMGEGALCFVGVSDYTAIPSVEAELKADRDNFVAGVEATTTASEMTTFAHRDKQLPAIAFDAESKSMHFRSIALVQGLRVAQIVGAVPKDGGDRNLLDQCVKSFKLLP